MAFPHALLVAKFLRNVPSWAQTAYVAVAATMAVVLTVWFLKSARTREPNRPGGAGPAVVLVILFFPLMAISMIWPITLPVALVVLLRQPSGPQQRGFPVIRGDRPASRTPEGRR